MTNKQALKKCEIFAVLNDAELEQVASLAVEKQYEAGDTIFKEGDNAAELLVLQEGKAVLQMIMQEAPGQTKRKVTVDIASKNDIIGWSAVVEPFTYTLTAVCLQRVKVLSINGNKLRGLLKDNHDIGFNILQGLIKVVALRLDETRQVLASERSETLKTG